MEQAESSSGQEEGAEPAKLGVAARAQLPRLGLRDVHAALVALQPRPDTTPAGDDALSAEVSSWFNKGRLRRFAACLEKAPFLWRADHLVCKKKSIRGLAYIKLLELLGEPIKGKNCVPRAMSLCRVFIARLKEQLQLAAEKSQAKGKGLEAALELCPPWARHADSYLQLLPEIFSRLPPTQSAPIEVQTSKKHTKKQTRKYTKRRNRNQKSKKVPLVATVVHVAGDQETEIDTDLRNFATNIMGALTDPYDINFGSDQDAEINVELRKATPPPPVHHDKNPDNENETIITTIFTPTFVNDNSPNEHETIVTTISTLPYLNDNSHNEREAIVTAISTPPCDNDNSHNEHETIVTTISTPPCVNDNSHNEHETIVTAISTPPCVNDNSHNEHETIVTTISTLPCVHDIGLNEHETNITTTSTPPCVNDNSHNEHETIVTAISTPPCDNDNSHTEHETIVTNISTPPRVNDNSHNEHETIVTTISTPPYVDDNSHNEHETIVTAISTPPRVNDNSHNEHEKIVNNISTPPCVDENSHNEHETIVTNISTPPRVNDNSHNEHETIVTTTTISTPCVGNSENDHQTNVTNESTSPYVHDIGHNQHENITTNVSTPPCFIDDNIDYYEANTTNASMTPGVNEHSPNESEASTLPCIDDYTLHHESQEKMPNVINENCDIRLKDNVVNVSTVTYAGNDNSDRGNETIADNECMLPCNTDVHSNKEYETNIETVSTVSYTTNDNSDKENEENLENYTTVTNATNDNSIKETESGIENASTAPCGSTDNSDKDIEPIIENVIVAPCDILSSDNEIECAEPAVDPLQHDTSEDDPGSKKSVTQLCRALLRRWIELQGETKTRIRSHLKVHTAASSEDPIVAVDLSDEEQSNINDDTGRKICDEPTKNDDREFQAAFNKIKTALMLEDTDDFAVSLSTRDVEGIERDEDEPVQRVQTKNITVSDHVAVESNTSHCDDGKSISMAKEKNIISGNKQDTGVEKDDILIHQSHIKEALSVGEVLEQDTDNKHPKKHVKKIKSKVKDDLMSKKKKICSKKEKIRSKSNNIPEQYEIDEASPIKDVKKLSKVDLVARKKTICSKRQNIHMKSDKNYEQDTENPRKHSHAKDKNAKHNLKICSKKHKVYRGKTLHQNRLKHKTIFHQEPSNKKHRKKRVDKEFKNAIELVIKNTAALQLSDGVRTEDQGLVRQQYSKDTVSDLPKEFSNVNSIQLAVIEKNMVTSRDDVELGVVRIRNYLFKRTHFKGFKSFDQDLEHFSEDGDNGKSNIVTSDETFSTNTISDSRKDSFDTINDVKEGVVEVYVMVPSPESNLRQHKVLHAPCPEVNSFEEHHVDENVTGLKSNIIGEDQGKDDAQNLPLNIVQNNEVNEYTAGPEPNGNDENAGLENRKEIDGVNDNSSNTQNNSDNLSQSTKQNDCQTVGKYNPDNKHSNEITSRSTISTNLTKQNHKTINTEQFTILQRDKDNREESSSINVNNITKTYASYKGKRKKYGINTKRERKRRISSQSDEYFFASDAVNENDIRDDSHNIAINKRDHMKVNEQEKIDNSEGVDVMMCDMRHHSHFNDCSDNNASNKSDHGKDMEVEKSVNDDAVDVDMSRHRSCNSASAGLSESEVDVTEAAFDPKLLVQPLVVLKRCTDQIRVIDNYNSLRHKSQSPPPQSSPNSKLRRFSGPKSVKNKRALKNSSNLNEDESEGTTTKRVKLPDIEEVRRKNRRMLTAQVTPITHQSGPVSAICEHVKSTNISTASVASSQESCSRCAAQRLSSSPENVDAKPRRGAAARARSFITSYAAMQHVRYKPPKIDVEPHHRKRRRHGYLLIEDASSDDAPSAMNEDSVRTSPKSQCLKKRRGSARLRSVSSDDATSGVNVDVVPSDVPRTSPESQCHKKRIQSPDDESSVVDVVSTRELITFEDEENTIECTRSTSRDASSLLDEDEQTTRELVSLENNPTSLKPVAESLSPNKVTPNQNEGSSKQELATVQNDRYTPRLESVAATHIASVPSSVVLNEGIPTQDLTVQNEEATDTYRRSKCATDVTSSSTKAAPSDLNAFVPTPALTEIQKKQEGNTSVKPVKIGVKSRRKRKRRGRPRFKSPKDPCPTLRESEPPPDVIASENEQETNSSSKPVTNFESVSSIAAHLDQNEGLAQNDHDDTNSLMRVTSSPDASAPNEDVATQDLTTIQKKPGTRRRKRKRRTRPRFKSPDDASSVPDECEPTRDPSHVEKQMTTSKPVIHSTSSPAKAASSVIDKRVHIRDLITFEDDEISLEPLLSNAAVSALNKRETTRELTTIRSKRKTHTHSSSKRVKRFASVSSDADFVSDEVSTPDPTPTLNIKTRSSKLIAQSVSTTCDRTDPNKNLPTAELTTSQINQTTAASNQISPIASVPTSPALLLSDEDTTRDLVQDLEDSDGISYDDPIILSDDDSEDFTIAPSDTPTSINPVQSVLNENTLAKVDFKRIAHAPSIPKATVLATQDDVVKALRETIAETQTVTQDDIVKALRGTVITTQNVDNKVRKDPVLATQTDIVKALKGPVPTTQDDVVKTRKDIVLATQDNVVKALRGPVLVTQDDVVKALKSTVLATKDNVAKALKGPILTTQGNVVKTRKDTALATQEDVAKALKDSAQATNDNVAKALKVPVLTTQDDVVKTRKDTILTTQENVVKALKGTVLATQENVAKAVKGPVLTTRDDVVKTRKRTVLATQEDVAKALKGTVLATQDNVAKAVKGSALTTQDDVVKTRKDTVLATQEDIAIGLKDTALATKDTIVETLKGPVPPTQDNIVKARKGTLLATQDDVLKALKDTALATQDEVVKVLEGTTLATQDDVVKALMERRKSADRNREPIISAVPSLVKRQNKPKLGFKPLLYRQKAVPNSAHIKESAVDLAQDEQETCTDYNDTQNEVESSKTVEDDGNFIDSEMANDGNWIDSEIEEDRASSIAQPLTDDNIADMIAEPSSAVVSDIHNSNVPDIGEEFDNQAMDAPDDFCPVIVSVRSLAPQQELTNDSNLQTQTTTVQPNPTITSNQSEPSCLTADNVQQVTPDDLTDNSAVSTNSPKVVACVVRVPSTQTNPNKDQSDARVSGSKDKSPFTVVTLKRVKTIKRVRATSLMNSSNDIQNLPSVSPVDPQKIKRLPKIVKISRVIPLPRHLEEQIKTQKKRPNSLLKPHSSIGTSSESQVTTAPLQFRKILPKVSNVSDIHPSQTDPTNVATLAPKSKQSNLPKITLKRAEPVFASHQNSLQPFLTSNSPMEEVQDETNLPKVVDVTGDLHVMQPDNQMGLHLVVSQPTVTSDVSFSTIKQIHMDNQHDDRIKYVSRIIDQQYVVSQDKASTDNSLLNINQVTEEAVMLSDDQIGLMNSVEVSTSNDNSLNINRPYMTLDGTGTQQDDQMRSYLVIPQESTSDSSPNINQNDTDETVMRPDDQTRSNLICHETATGDGAPVNPNDITVNSNNLSETSNVVPRRISLKRRPSVPLLVRSVMSGRRDAPTVKKVCVTGVKTVGELVNDLSSVINYRTVEDWLISGCAATIPSAQWARDLPQDSLLLLCVGPAVWATRGPRPYLLLSERAPPPPVFALWTVSPRRGLELPEAESYTLESPPRKIIDHVAYQKVSDDPVTYAKLLVAVSDARAGRDLLERGAPLQLYCLQTCRLFPLRAEFLHDPPRFLLTGDAAVAETLVALKRELSQLGPLHPTLQTPAPNTSYPTASAPDILYDTPDITIPGPSTSHNVTLSSDTFTPAADHNTPDLATPWPSATPDTSTPETFGADEPAVLTLISRPPDPAGSRAATPTGPSSRPPTPPSPASHCSISTETAPSRPSTPSTLSAPTPDISPALSPDRRPPRSTLRSPLRSPPRSALRSPSRGRSAARSGRKPSSSHRSSHRPAANRKTRKSRPRDWAVASFAGRSPGAPCAKWDVPDAQFLAAYRLPRARAQALVDRLRPLLPPMELGDMEPDEKVLTCLSFLATGLSPGSVSACAAVAQVVDALNQDQVYQAYVRFPETPKERADIKRRFFSLYNLPGVVGAMAALHVPVLEPGEDDQDYFNGVFHSLNVQVICDADQRILSVDSSHGGATHSCAAWLEHQLNYHVKFLRDQGEKVCLLADASYPQQESTLTPIEDPRARIDKLYNAAHARAHAVASECVDALRARWRCLSTASETTAPTQTIAATIVGACAVLHNIAKGVELPVDEEFASSERRAAASVAAAQGSAAGHLASGPARRPAGRLARQLERGHMARRAVARQLDNVANAGLYGKLYSRPAAVPCAAPDLGELIARLRRGRDERARLAQRARDHTVVLDDDDD